VQQATTLDPAVGVWRHTYRFISGSPGCTPYQQLTFDGQGGVAQFQAFAIESLTGPGCIGLTPSYCSWSYSYSGDYIMSFTYSDGSSKTVSIVAGYGSFTYLRNAFTPD